MLQPLATIELDTPGSHGAVRGVVCATETHIVVIDPRTGEQTVHEPLTTTSVADALDIVHRSWSICDWGLTWLVEDPEDWPETLGEGEG